MDPTGANINSSDSMWPTSLGSYTEQLLEINPMLSVGGYPEVWTEYTAIITGITGTVNTRVAFRYWVTDVGTNSNYIGLELSSIIEDLGEDFPYPY